MCDGNDICLAQSLHGKARVFRSDRLGQPCPYMCAGNASYMTCLYTLKEFVKVWQQFLAQAVKAGIIDKPQHVTYSSLSDKSNPVIHPPIGLQFHRQPVRKDPRLDFVLLTALYSIYLSIVMTAEATHRRSYIRPVMMSTYIF